MNDFLFILIGCSWTGLGPIVFLGVHRTYPGITEMKIRCCLLILFSGPILWVFCLFLLWSMLKKKRQ